MTSHELTGSVRRLAALGDALEQSAAHDLAMRLRTRRRTRRLVAVFAVPAVIVVTGASFAAVRLISGRDVAASMPAGTLWLAGT